MPTITGKSVGLLLSVLDGLCAEHPRYERELRECARRIRAKSLDHYHDSDVRLRQVYREVRQGYATVAEIAQRTKLAPATVYGHLRKLTRQKLVFRARAPRSHDDETRKRGGDQCSYLYLPL